MASRQMRRVGVRGLRRAILLVLPAAMLVAGCARMNPLKRHVEVQLNTAPPAVTPAIEAGNDYAYVTRIVKTLIQPGRYAEAEKALRRYLKQHRADRRAQSMLRQLTADPQEMLGRQRRMYVVRSGDSYSALADRYLHDADMFLILARYNGSTRPSLLQLGEKIYLPLSVPREDQADRAIIAATSEGSEPEEPGQAGATAPTSSGYAPAGPSSATKASQLQDESVLLQKQGHPREALARLDQALTLDPQLKTNGSASASLRSQLVAQYHQRAIVLYRGQQLDQAITLWDRVLSINPGFEPAIVYRGRALELKRRLREL